MRTEVQYIIEATGTAIILFWVLTHAGEFATVTGAVSAGVVGSFRTLIGYNQNGVKQQ